MNKESLEKEFKKLAKYYEVLINESFNTNSYEEYKECSLKIKKTNDAMRTMALAINRLGGFDIPP